MKSSLKCIVFGCLLLAGCVSGSSGAGEETKEVNKLPYIGRFDVVKDSITNEIVYIDHFNQLKKI